MKSKRNKLTKKVKKDLEKETKKWFNSLSNSNKLNSKKKVNKFIDNLKKKCKKERTKKKGGSNNNISLKSNNSFRINERIGKLEDEVSIIKGNIDYILYKLDIDVKSESSIEM